MPQRRCVRELFAKFARAPSSTCGGGSSRVNLPLWRAMTAQEPLGVESTRGGERERVGVVAGDAESHPQLAMAARDAPREVAARTNTPRLTSTFTDRVNRRSPFTVARQRPPWPLPSPHKQSCLSAFGIALRNPMSGRPDLLLGWSPKEGVLRWLAVGRSVQEVASATKATSAASQGVRDVAQPASRPASAMICSHTASSWVFMQMPPVGRRCFSHVAGARPTSVPPPPGAAPPPAHT